MSSGLSLEPSKKNEFTILIPTNTYSQFLDRVLDYYAETKPRVIIFDTFKTPWERKSEYWPEVKYIHAPGTPFRTQMLQLCEMVETPYTVICGRDDFISPRAIQNGVNFLSAHPDYSVADGYTGVFIKHGSVVVHTPFPYSAVIRQDARRESDDVKQRILCQLENPISSFYSIHRTQTLKTTFSIADKVGLNSHELCIMLADFATLLAGKHKPLHEYYSAREDGWAITGGRSIRPYFSIPGNEIPWEKAKELLFNNAELKNWFEKPMQERLEREEKVQGWNLPRPSEPIPKKTTYFQIFLKWVKPIAGLGTIVGFLYDQYIYYRSVYRLSQFPAANPREHLKIVLGPERKNVERFIFKHKIFDFFEGFTDQRWGPPR